MRGAWLVCALSLALARETPLPGDPALNEQWLEGFRRDLLRDAYDYDTALKPSPNTLGQRSSGRDAYHTRAPKNASHATPSRTSRDLSAVRRRANKIARDAMGRVSGKPSLDPSVGRPSRLPARHTLADKSVGQSDESGLPSDAPDGRSVGYSSGKPLARRSKDEESELSSESVSSDMSDAPSVGHSSGKPEYTDRQGPARHASTGKPGRPLDASFIRRASGRPPAQALDDAASRELGISRRDLYGGRRSSITGLDAKRGSFLKSVADLDNQMRPVVIRPDLDIDIQSRKRLGQESGEQNQEKPDYIIDDRNGVKLYRVHTNRKERFQNQFGRDQPWLKEDWGIDEMPEPNAHQDKDDSAQSEDRYESREPKQDSALEVEVSEYNQDNLRSRYMQDGRSNGDYAQRFSARRDAALLADGLASSDKPCHCMTDNPQIVPEL